MSKDKKFTLKIKPPKMRSGSYDFKSKDCLIFADRRTKRLKTRQDQQRNWNRDY